MRRVRRGYARSAPGGLGGASDVDRARADAEDSLMWSHSPAGCGRGDANSTSQVLGESPEPGQLSSASQPQPNAAWNARDFRTLQGTARVRSGQAPA